MVAVLTNELPIFVKVTALLIILAVLFFYAYGRYLQKNKQNKTSDDETDNEFIYWHIKVKDNRRAQAAMLEAVKKIDRNRRLKRQKDYPAYLNWCKLNKEAPFITLDKLNKIS